MEKKRQVTFAAYARAFFLLGLIAILPLPARCGPGSTGGTIYTFDARPLNRLDLKSTTNAATVWDTLHVLAAVQGLANRTEPQLYLFYCSGFGVDTDQFWFDWLRGEDGWLKNAEVRNLATLEEVLRVFGPSFKGLVVYDPAVPSTSNAASTAAGCEDLVPVRFDRRPGSVYTRLAGDMGLPVKLWLVNPDGSSKFTGSGQVPDLDGPSSKSAKVDCYRWAVARYLGKSPARMPALPCAPGMAAYYIDAFWLQHPLRADPTMHTLSNHDYFIARRAFFFDLSPWGDEVPGDDPRQPLGADKDQFLKVMRALYERAQGGIIKVGGFTPWPYKYTTHSAPAGKHEGVPTEWEFGRLISQFNGYMEADAAGLAAMANASFFKHYPLAQRYAQPNPKPTSSEWRKKGILTTEGRPANKLFVGHYVGDYDAPSWLYKAVAAFFPQAERGRVPLGWAFDPNLADRAAPALAYAYRHATKNDFFIAGDSGAGYLNPRGLSVRPDSGLPSGLELWVEHCRKYYERWGMSISGFILDGSSGASTSLEYAAYKRFSPDGAGTHFEPGPAIKSGMPSCPERDLPDSVEQAAKIISDLAGQGKDGPRFLWARSILKPPRWYDELERSVAKTTDGSVEFVDPYTFFELIRLQLTL